MFDERLRIWKDRVFLPLARMVKHVSPTAVTTFAFVLGLGSAVCAAFGLFGWGLCLWIANRIFDGLDGFVARAWKKTSDAGAYLDLVFDFVVYAAIVLGFGIYHGSNEVWSAVAVLLAAFYVNSVTWSVLTALGEKRTRSTGAVTNSVTGVKIVTGLVEGFETILVYCAFFVWPSWSFILMIGFAALVLLTATLRTVVGFRSLRKNETP